MILRSLEVTGDVIGDRYTPLSLNLKSISFNLILR